MTISETATKTETETEIERASEDSEVATPLSKTQNNRAMISIEDLSLVFETNDGSVNALSHIDLDIGEGDFVSFIGPSGCGKTTLLRVIADLEKPTSGKIFVDGTSPEDARLNRLYGYVFQAPALFPWRTIDSNCKVPLEIFGVSKALQQQKTDKYLALVGLQAFHNKFPWQLSGGMQQRASIARALCFEPQLLLMDEPFGALDEITRDHLNLELLKIWRETGKTVVFVTHSIPEAVLLSTHIVVMSPRPGRIAKVIKSPLPKDRRLEDRESPEFVAVMQEVREALANDHRID
ncbi:ABC transporter ATP-binding protein [Marinomonas mediterranea]|jgi:ABC-type nitrate/sulfonate/bicarbonate transport system, ATPase component|uniref:Taurine-transporting ATPase n=1 Tax=Marinomonas mediterranea (strain ATCC 700492 / JCM 21426 / NBRC 103028 / MMB-1) TaxID=717774 RepID=F2JWG6_MARM1|nr:ABC transporter ATP-binding protein [Marinomonas mediterranea]ADZ90639.1 Taurine-transporting ATPase [Marinomonas mediterranea MMB-1]WCN08681.1 ATP-binding cassette domain-containing protein [Marinomonas mediterranea]WCN16809.1 ATP-binding cassette domain-containing protein [Marinomonas mediterranea MMB-1]